MSQFDRTSFEGLCRQLSLRAHTKMEHYGRLYRKNLPAQRQLSRPIRKRFGSIVGSGYRHVAMHGFHNDRHRLHKISTEAIAAVK